MNTARAGVALLCLAVAPLVWASLDETPPPRQLGPFERLAERIDMAAVEALIAETQKEQAELHELYPELPDDIEVLETVSPNSPETRKFLQRLAPDIVVARCKTLISVDIFSIPRDGILILHPGICPELCFSPILCDCAEGWDFLSWPY